MPRQGRWSTLGLLAGCTPLYAALPAPTGQVLLHFVPSSPCPQARVDMRNIEGGKSEGYKRKKL